MTVPRDANDLAVGLRVRPSLTNGKGDWVLIAFFVVFAHVRRSRSARPTVAFLNTRRPHVVVILTERSGVRDALIESHLFVVNSIFVTGSESIEDHAARQGNS